MNFTRWHSRLSVAAGMIAGQLFSQDGKVPSSYSPVVIQEPFASVMKRMSAAKAGVMQDRKSVV